MDPLSISASLITLLQATNMVLSIFYDYSSAMNGAPWGLTNLIDETRSLRDVQEALVCLVRDNKASRLPTLRMLCQPHGPLEIGIKQLEALEERLLSSEDRDRPLSRRRAFVQTLTWPMKEAETRRTTEDIQRLGRTLSMAMETDQTRLILAIEELAVESRGLLANTRDGIAQLQRTCTSIENESVYRKLKAWLAAADPSTNHNAARRNRCSSTGKWFFDSKEFVSWKEFPGILWLYGPTGCGKTSLTSGIIDNLGEVCYDDLRKVFAYFYFDFNDSSQQSPDMLLRSLISQLIPQCESIPDEAEASFNRNKQRQPTTEELLSILRPIITSYDVYLVVDALDECADMQGLWDIIGEIDCWGSERLHLLITSRENVGANRFVQTPEEITKVPIQTSLVAEDIRLYIQQRLKFDSSLARWNRQPDIANEITETIVRKANGMFRWAACQVDALGNCLNVSMLRKTLATMPTSLYDMYSQALAEVPGEHAELVSKTLQWLAYSTRPLYIEEIAEIATVNMSSRKSFDPDNRLLDPQDIISICPGMFITTTAGSDLGSPDVSEQLRLAHFSVKEYLLSAELRTSSVGKFAMTESKAHATIANDCMAYISQFDRPFYEIPETVRSSPLLRYATNYWVEHLKRSGQEAHETSQSTALQIFRSETIYANWIAFLEGYTPNSSDEDGVNALPDPLYYAASYGLRDICRTLISAGSLVNSRGPAGTALAAACLSGELGTVRNLVESGADVNAEGPIGSPLLLAASKGYLEVVQYLLQKGADAGYRSETGETPLREAQKQNYPDIVRLIHSAL